MENIKLLLENDLAVLFMILTLGCLIGRIKIFGIALSSSGGVLFAALFFGHHHYTLPENIGTFGFAFFIYAIGFGAGPRFFQTFRKNGLKYMMAAVFVAVVATAIAVACAYIFKLQWLLLPGILAGSLTSTATLAAAYELVKDPIISVGYGITYPFGLIGLLLLIQYLPKYLHISLKKEAQEVNPEADDEETESFQRRIFCVRNPGIIGITLKDLDLRRLTGIGLLTIRRNEQIELANADTKLYLNDHVLVEGTIQNLLEMEDYIGPEVIDDAFKNQQYESICVVVINNKVCKRTVSELGLSKKFGVILTKVEHSGVVLDAQPDTRLQRGDIVTLVGTEAELQHVSALLGRPEHKIYETDIFTFSAGLLLGLFLGTIELPIINTSIGSAGGLLFTGIILGYLRNFGPFAGRVPLAARYILQELGLLLFLASVGTSAGVGLVEQLATAGPAIFVSGVLITSITLLATIFFCHKVLKFDWNTTFGATTGGLTSTVALKIVTRQAESQYAALGYAGVYAFANILLTILGQVILLFR